MQGRLRVVVGRTFAEDGLQDIHVPVDGARGCAGLETLGPPGVDDRRGDLCQAQGAELRDEYAHAAIQAPRVATLQLPPLTLPLGRERREQRGVRHRGDGGRRGAAEQPLGAEPLGGGLGAFLRGGGIGGSGVRHPLLAGGTDAAPVLAPQIREPDTVVVVQQGPVSYHVFSSLRHTLDTKTRSVNRKIRL